MKNKKDNSTITEHNNVELEQTKKNQRIHDIVSHRLSHIRRKLSRGAANIYRVIRSRCKWGNKNLWGHENINNHKGKHKK